MTEPVLYMRGFPPPYRSIPESLVGEARQLLSLDESVMVSLCSRLEAESGFLTVARLRSVISTVEIDGCENDVVFRILRWANRVRQLGELDDAFEFLAEASLEGEEKPAFSADDIENLQGRVNRLLDAAPSLERQYKADELCRATGQRLQQINLVCDLRPVFDADREAVEGLLPITTIRLIAEGADGLPVSFEATMSKSDVSQLCDVANRAQQKLARLHKLSDEMRKPIPSTELTTLDSEDD